MIRIFKILFIGILFVLDTLCAKNLEKVSLQLQWLDQFQFAGYYIAKEKGFYKNVNLDVEIKKFNSGISVVDEVISNQATYGVGRSTLIIDKSNGKDIVLLAPIFQSSPLMLLATENSAIKNIEDFKNKRIMFTQDAAETASLVAMTNKYNINIKDMILQKHSFNVDDLINNKTDLMASYISNEPFILKQKGFNPRIFHPRDYGFDFYSDILFTSKHEIKNHKQRTKNFIKASIKGWEYAFSHIDETIELIFTKYNVQEKSKEALRYEANELKKLAYYKTNKLGNIDIYKIQRIYDVYNVMGLIKHKINLDKFIFYDDKYEIEFTQEERNYLLNKKEITVCVKKNWLPYEGIEDGEFIGISADFLNLNAKRLNIPLKIIKIQTQVESVKLLQDGICDVKPLLTRSSKTMLPFKSTKEYLKDSISLVTRMEQPFLSNLSYLNNKKIVVANGFKGINRFINKEYPKIKFEKVESIDKALALVASGKVFGYIGTSLTSSYKIQKDYSTKLKIVNDFKPFKFGIGVINTQPQLLTILNKTIQSITKEEKQKLLNKWIVTTVEKKQNYTIVWQIIFISLVIIGIILYWMFKFKNEVQKRQKAEIKVLELNYTLEYKVETTLNDLHNAQKLAKIGSWKYSIEDNILVWDDEAYNIFGIDKNLYPELTFTNYLDLISIDDGYQFFQAYDKHLHGKAPFLITHKIVTQCGKIKYIEERCETIFDKDDHPVISKGTVQDVTEQKEIQLKLEQKDKQMFHQSRLAQMGEMIGMIAHQWRQPLNAISLTANNLTIKCIMNNMDKELFIKEIGLISEYSQHLSKTINDFRGFFQKDKLKDVITFNEIVNDTLDIIKVSVENKNIQIIVNVNCTDKFETYAHEVKQVLLNIIKNSEDILIDREIQNAKITIETKVINDINTLVVRDNAGGIPKEIMDNIFDPYFSTKLEKDGTGLGLYMSKTIIEEHCHGYLGVLNDDDGAVFMIQLNKNKI